MKRLTDPGRIYEPYDIVPDNLLEWANKLREYEDTELTPEQVEELIKKQRPEKIDRRVLPRDLKVGNVKFKAGTTTYHCPSCKKAVTGGCNYCPHCGQRLEFKAWQK